MEHKCYEKIIWHLDDLKVNAKKLANSLTFPIQSTLCASYFLNTFPPNSKKPRNFFENSKRPICIAKF